MIPRPFANTLSLLETFVSRRKARLFSPRSCLTAQLKLANRKFCPIALSGKVCHSEGGGWRVSRRQRQQGGGSSGGCLGWGVAGMGAVLVLAENRQNTRNSIYFTNLKHHSCVGATVAIQIWFTWTGGARWRWQGQFENGCKPRCCCNDAKRLWHQTQLTQVYDKSVGKRDLDSERPANH